MPETDKVTELATIALLVLPQTIMSLKAPRKLILTPEQLSAFQKSDTHLEIISYIEKLNDAVIGVPLQYDCSESEV